MMYIETAGRKGILVPLSIERERVRDLLSSCVLLLGSLAYAKKSIFFFTLYNEKLVDKHLKNDYDTSNNF